MPLEFQHEFPYTIGNSEKCKHLDKHYDVDVFWLPIKQRVQYENGEDQWVDDRQQSKEAVIQEPKWGKGEPNGFDFQQCVQAIGQWDQWTDQFCTVLTCSACNMPIVQTYRLRGPQLFDQVYSLLLNMQSSDTEIVFEGEGTSKIVWYPLEEKTVISNYKTNKTIEFRKDPFGILQSKEGVSTNKWKFTNVSFIFIFKMQIHF